MSWNDERVDLLKKLWVEGLSASQIAGRIGGVTRNAVIGKVHRLGLSGRAQTTRSSTQIRPRPARITTSRRPHKPRPAQQIGNVAVRNVFALEAEPYVSAFEEIDIPMAERKTLQDLTEASCRWPIGDPQTVEFHFCNRSKVTGLPYCEFHARRAFQPPQPRRRDRVGVESVVTALARETASAKPSSKEPVDA